MTILTTKTVDFVALSLMNKRKSQKEYRQKNKEKRSKQFKKWRTKNRDKEIERNKEWKRKNKEKVKIYKRKYYLEHKERDREKKNERNRKYRIRHNKKCREYGRRRHKEKMIYLEKNPKLKEKWLIANRENGKRYYLKNPDIIKKRNKKWQNGNKELFLLSRRATGQRRRTQSKDLTLQVIQQVYERNIVKYNVLVCELCFEKVKFGEDSLDHKTPLVRGGNNSLKNLCVSHRTCNSKKHDKTLKEWFKLYPKFKIKESKWI